MPTTLTAYTFEELSPEAQARALESIPWDDCEHTASECMHSLKAFARKLGFNLRDWSIGDPQRSFTAFGLDPAIAELSGARGFAWIENNVMGPCRQNWALVASEPKWTAVHGKYARRYYKPGEVKACPFAGVCFDEDILDAFRDRDPRLTIGERFASIGDRLSRVIEAELEYANSEAGRRERADIEFEDALFDEDGNKLR